MIGGMGLVRIFVIESVAPPQGTQGILGELGMLPRELVYRHALHLGRIDSRVAGIRGIEVIHELAQQRQ